MAVSGVLTDTTCARCSARCDSGAAAAIVHAFQWAAFVVAPISRLPLPPGPLRRASPAANRAAAWQLCREGWAPRRGPDQAGAPTHPPTWCLVSRLRMARVFLMRRSRGWYFCSARGGGQRGVGESGQPGGRRHVGWGWDRCQGSADSKSFWARLPAPRVQGASTPPAAHTQGPPLPGCCQHLCPCWHQRQQGGPAAQDSLCCDGPTSVPVTCHPALAIGPCCHCCQSSGWGPVHAGPRAAPYSLAAGLP